MSDNWNIKKYGIDCWESGNPDEMWKTYHEKYLQILKEKLIEDIEEYISNEYNSPNISYIKDLINKRFGDKHD